MHACIRGNVNQLSVNRNKEAQAHITELYRFVTDANYYNESVQTVRCFNNWRLLVNSRYTFGFPSATIGGDGDTGDTSGGSHGNGFVYSAGACIS